MDKGAGVGLATIVSIAVIWWFGLAAFVPNHPQLTMDAQNEWLSESALQARLDEACGPPSLLLRGIQKEPSEVTVHVTTQLGATGTVIVRCVHGRADTGNARLLRE